ncbi:MAG TPA: hypothetical protein VG733_01915 [Chthoniobacteraceae bacterium]|nr:hypothetical protein [Chthoniobacteraceae bacterium]
MKTLRKLLKLPLTLALGARFIRERAAHHFLIDYYPDLQLSIPLGDGFHCPLLTRDAVHSFSEIFVAGEYAAVFDEIPLPRRWIDLGSHAGYFSLWLAWRLAAAGQGREWNALLVDADPRMEPLARAALDRNGLAQNYQYLSGLISKGGGDRDFALRDGMISSMDIAARNGEAAKEVRRVGIVTPAAILAALPPPYDLVKVDIEGGEADFVECYKDVYTHARAILMEWHSRDREGAAAAPLRAALEAGGFVYVKDVRRMRAEPLDGGWCSSGVQLYRRAP